MLTQEVDDLLKTVEPYFPRAEANIVMARFRAGEFITVSRATEPHADLKRMIDVDEVWVLCFRKPRSGGQGRLLGRFIEKDVFVGLAAHLRDDLGGAAYANRAGDAISLWDDQINCTVLRGESLGDYLSPNFRDMDNDDY